jgi:hypothetical protein
MGGRLLRAADLKKGDDQGCEKGNGEVHGCDVWIGAQHPDDVPSFAHIRETRFFPAGKKNAGRAS